MSKDVLDFIVIGAQKAGTTSLFEYLRAHPELYLPSGKEKPFFSHDEIHAAGWQAFLASVFVDAPPDRLWGKVTPWYMAGCPVRDDSGAPETLTAERAARTIPERIRATLPDVKLVAILRDPVERCVSHYRMGLLSGREPRSFDQAIAELLSPDALERARLFRGSSAYVVFGEYGRVLGGYYAVFPPEQLFVGFTSELQSSPGDFMRELFGFLGVDRSFAPPNLGVRYREGGGSRRVKWLGSPSSIEKRLVGWPGVRSIWRAIPARTQRRVEARLREVNYRIDLWNRRGRDPLVASPDTLARLREHYEQDRAVLERLIGKPVAWRAPDPTLVR